MSALDTLVRTPLSDAEAAALLVDLGLTSAARALLGRVNLATANGARLTSARLAAAEGRSDVASAEYRALVAANGHPRLFVEAARQMRALGDFAAAASFAFAAQDDATDADADLLGEAALALLVKGDTDGAIAELRRAVALSQTDRHVLDALLILISRQRFRDAERVVEQLQPVIEAEVGDALSFRKALEDLRAGVRSFTAATEAADEGRGTLMHLRPHVPSNERPLHELDVAAAEPGEPQKFYVLENLLADGYGGEGTLELADLVGEDLARLGWTPPQQRVVANLQFVVPDCFVYDNLGCHALHTVVTRDGRFLPELVWGLAPVNATRVALRPNENPESDVALAFVPPARWWNNYYHAVVDVLSSVELYHRLALDCPIVLPGRVTELHSTLLEASGVPAHAELLTTQEIAGARIGLAIAPQPLSGQLVRQWSRRVVKSLSVGRAGASEDILFISRRNSAKRRLANELELEAALEANFGAKVVTLEECPLREQIELVSRAGIVVGAHGAGLTNVLFAQHRLALVELLPEHYRVWLFGSLAAVAGHDYFPIFGVDDTRDGAGELKMTWHVDLDKVQRVLERLVSHRR